MHEALRLYLSNAETDRESKYKLKEEEKTEEVNEEDDEKSDQFVSDAPILYSHTYLQFIKKYEPPRNIPAPTRKRKIDQITDQQAKRAKLN